MRFRPSAETRRIIARAARAGGHSLSAEIDLRLRQAYWSNDRHRREQERAYGGSHNLCLAFLLARVATGVEHACGATWQGDLLIWREVATALVALLQMMRGLGGGVTELPVRVDGRPNPAWDVETLSRTRRPVAGIGHLAVEVSEPPHWFEVLGLIDAILSGPTELRWPLVDTFKGPDGDACAGMIPIAEQLWQLYVHAGAVSAAHG